MAIPKSISSNCTSLSYAVERENVLPENLKYTLLDPASYTGPFGGEREYITATTVGSGRAPQKGRPAGETSGAAIETYMRQAELQPFLPGFFVNFPVESPSTNRLRPAADRPGAEDNSTISKAATDGYEGTDFDHEGFSTATKDKLLYFATGFGVSSNNGFKVGSAQATAGKLAVADLTAEDPASPGAAIQTCGYQSGGASGQLAVLSVSGGLVTLASDSLKEGGVLEQPPGAFIHIGGDSASSRYAGTNPSVEATRIASPKNLGWARIKEVTSTGVVCDLTTFTAQNNPATNQTIQVFTPTRIFKDDVQCDASRITTYAFERRLGKSDTDLPNEQSQLVTGSFPNQLDIAIGSKTDVKATLQFLSEGSERRNGGFQAGGTIPDANQAPWSGNNRAPLDKGDFYVSSDDIKYARLYQYDNRASLKRSVFGLITDGTFTLNNNAKDIPGWGFFSAYDINPGDLMVDMNVTALFTSTEAIDLSEEGLNAGMYVIFARKNAGFILDIPLVTVQSSALTVEPGEAIMIEVTNQGNESDFGYAASLQFFDYLPTVATKKQEFQVQKI